MSEEKKGPGWGQWLVLTVAVVVGLGLLRGNDHDGAASADPSPTAAAPSVPGSGGAPSAGSSAKPSKPSGRYDPADYAEPVRRYATEAGVNPQLLMAILYNESYKPHDPELERAWQRGKPDASFGIANMHRAAFDDTKPGRPFASRQWEELPDDRDLAVQAAAWHLHDLAAQLPARPGVSLSRDELVALGYNAGAGNMLAFARGVKIGSQAQSYLDRLRDNWSKSGEAVK
ncbi:lytic transglycosylase domain-containing protein [Kitasatospora xanthocidica]|uniref:Lytic transglycosylase domain-containing protein n=1 Tax=Kitasatospora xanthocidica TaxID=83382 RepID=A0A372ZIJ3_9ACTN|nr:transglycosylase SLT domain-containing protein [Kitasatospora xanthocidica]RGD55669.1 lytic transglycosylase domain-containing protein [Kitasatospora xanthocidica]